MDQTAPHHPDLDAFGAYLGAKAPPPPGEAVVVPGGGGVRDQLADVFFCRLRLSPVGLNEGY